MQLIKTVIIDDEEGSRITLQELVKEYCPQLKICGLAENAEEGYQIIRETKPTLVFLDIEMPGGNGFSLLDKFDEIGFDIIFVTAFDNYAIRAFKYAAVHYILKPVSITELREAVARATEKQAGMKSEQKIALLLENLRHDDVRLHKISLPTANGLSFEDVCAIMYLKAEGSYTKVFTQSKNELISRNLKEFEDILPQSVFCRIHHSYIINMNFVKKYTKGRGGYVEMSNGTEIEVSVRKKEEFLNRFR